MFNEKPRGSSDSENNTYKHNNNDEKTVKKRCVDRSVARQRRNQSESGRNENAAEPGGMNVQEEVTNVAGKTRENRSIRFCAHREKIDNDETCEIRVE